MKLYLVEHSAGQYSDHNSYVSAIFDNRKDAEGYSKKIVAYYERIKRMEPPTDEEEGKKWLMEKWDADDFNSAKVIEIELGVVEKRFVE